jgi:hypothetical protein
MSPETGSNQQGDQSGGALFAIGHFANSRKKFVIGVALLALFGASFCGASSRLLFQLRTA